MANQWPCARCGTPREAEEAQERLVRERKPEVQALLERAEEARREALAHLSRVREEAHRAGVSYDELEP